LSNGPFLLPLIWIFPFFSSALRETQTHYFMLLSCLRRCKSPWEADDNYSIWLQLRRV
jgi:hypothetical protein